MAGSNSNYSILVDVQLQEESIKKQLKDIQSNIQSFEQNIITSSSQITENDRLADNLQKQIAQLEEKRTDLQTKLAEISEDIVKKLDEKLKDAGFRLYKGDVEVGLIYDSGKGAYRPVASEEKAEEMKSATNGKFNIIGLDAGTYTLKETTTPEGYNTCAPITIEIKATHSENAGGTAANLSLTDSKNMSNDVINKSGSTLPGTGGIGTTVFYIGGGCMVALAGVFLITKKRMGKKED